MIVNIKHNKGYYIKKGIKCPAIYLKMIYIIKPIKMEKK